MHTTVLLSRTASAPVPSGEPVEAVLSPIPHGEVMLWVRKGLFDQAPDRFVLTGTRASGAGEATEVYRSELDRTHATQGTVAPCSLRYTSATNEIGGTSEDDLRDPSVRYTLEHWPGGVADGRLTVFEGRTWEQTFGSQGTAATALAVFVGAVCYLSDAVRMPETALGTLGLRREVALEKPRGALGDDDEVLFAQDRDLFAPTAVRNRAWAAGGPPRAVDGHAVGEPPPEDAALRAGDRWLYLVGREATSDPTPESPAYQARPAGIWKAEAPGTYTFHVHDDAEDAPSPLRAVGTASPCLLLNAELVDDRAQTVFAHVSPFPLPQASVDGLVRQLAEGGDAPATPLGFVPASVPVAGMTVYERESPHAEWNASGGHWEWFLPDSLRVTARLVQKVEAAVSRVGAWTRAASDVETNAALVRATCYEPAHGRDHLRGILADGGPDLREVWDGGPGDVPAPRSSAALERYRYGSARQRAYLRHRARVFGHRLEAWVRSPLVGALSADLVAVADALGEDPVYQALTSRLFDGLVAMTEGGAGGAATVSLLDEAGVLAALDRVQAAADLAGVVAPLQAAPEATLADRLADPTLKKWFYIARKNGKEAAKLLQALTPGVIASTDVAESVQGAGPLVVALFGEELFAADAGTGSPVFAETRTTAAGRVLHEVTWHAGDQRYRVGGLFEVRRRNVAGLQRRAVGGTYTFEFWEIAYTRDVAVVRGGEQMVRAGSVLSGSLSAINGLFLGTAIFDSARSKTLGASDAVRALQLAKEIAEVYKSMGRPVGGAARTLIKLGPVLEATSAGLTFYEGVRGRRRYGQSSVPDRDEAKMAAAVMSGAGSLLLGAAGTFAGGALALVTSPIWGTAAVVGLGLTAAGAVWAWRGDVAQTAREREDDPLSTWLRDRRPAEGSLWGAAGGGDRAQAFALVEPGWSGGGPAVLADEMETQTRTFLETAYTFPLTADVTPAPDGSLRLALHVVPEYVTETGTLMVVASATYRNARGLPASVPIRCALHYTTDGDGFRYAVRAESASLLAGADPDALKSEWAPSVLVKRPGSGPLSAPRPGLVVYLGDWPVLPADLRTTVHEGLRAGAREATGRFATVDAAIGAAGDLSRRVAAYRRQSGGADVWPAARLAAPGLADALAAKRFVVTGFAVFDPTAPFQPAPTIPETRPLPEEIVAAQELGGPDGFRYPEDAR